MNYEDAGAVEVRFETTQSEDAPQLTAEAVSRVNELIASEGDPNLKLRVFVTGGGCSGFQYGFTFDRLVAEDDALIERDGVSMLIDAMSFPYLANAEVDYEVGLQGSRFVVHNPNVSGTCGCGSSFSV